MERGLDVSADCSTRVADLAHDGYTFLGRYLLNDATNEKYLHPAEVARVKAAGLLLVTLWELRPTVVTYFTRAQGRMDATHSRTHAFSIGQPAGSAIYYCVDYDASPSEVNSAITEYFQGIAEGMAAPLDGVIPSYAVGVYGSGLTCRTIYQKHLAVYCWLACSTGWTGTPGYNDWNIMQLASTRIHELDAQTDVSNGKFGGW